MPEQAHVPLPYREVGVRFELRLGDYTSYDQIGLGVLLAKAEAELPR